MKSADCRDVSFAAAFYRLSLCFSPWDL